MFKLAFSTNFLEAVKKVEVAVVVNIISVKKDKIVKVKQEVKVL